MQIVPSTSSVPRAVSQYLLPHEQQVITVRFHPTVLVGPVALVLAGLAGAWAASSSHAFSSDAMLIIWLAWGLLFLYLIGKVLSWLTGYFAVTAYRLVVLKGALARDFISLPNDKVASIRFRRSAWGRILGYGQFVIESERTQPMWTINYLPYPEQLYLEVIALVYREREQNPD